MKLTTTYKFNAQPEELWPLLFNSKMDEKHPCFFLCGLPKPVECRLADGEGGVGKTRECVSDKGVIIQRIVAWQPNHLLEFHLQETNLYFGPCVNNIKERFELKKINSTQTVITRKTEFHVTSFIKLFISIPIAVGLKSIHHYVFRNWKRIAKERNAELKF